MIVDTSALVAIISAEPHAGLLNDALLEEARIIVPAPVLTEFRLVTGGRGQALADQAAALVSLLLAAGAEVAPFTHRHAQITATARERFGKGNGSGGLLNFGDLMVYATAKDRGEPLLCTGRDFASTDLELHPASRLEP